MYDYFSLNYKTEGNLRDDFEFYYWNTKPGSCNPSSILINIEGTIQTVDVELDNNWSGHPDESGNS